MPDDRLYVTNLSNTKSTSGGYIAVSGVTDDALTMINGAFTDKHVLSHREYLSNAVTDGQPSAGAWYDSLVVLPNEPMIYGSYVYTPGTYKNLLSLRLTIDKTQLSALKANSNLITATSRGGYWLRDVVSSIYFAVSDGYCRCYYYDVDTGSFGIRPVFGLRG